MSMIKCSHEKISVSVVDKLHTIVRERGGVNVVTLKQFL